MDDTRAAPAPRPARPRARRVPRPALNQLARTARANLRRRFARQPIAFAISGGGSQGSFEAGALRFLYDDLGIRPRILCGISVGAMIAAKLAEGDGPLAPHSTAVRAALSVPDGSNGSDGSGLTQSRAIDELEVIWRGLRANYDMWVSQPWLDTLRAQAGWAGGLRERAGDLGSDAGQVRVVVRILAEVLRHPRVADTTLDAVRQALRAQSLLSSEPVRRLVGEWIDPSRIASSGLMLRIGAVSLETGRLVYFTERGEARNRDDSPADLAPVDLREAIMASSAIPVLFPPVRLGHEHFVDGGAREVLPVRLAFEHLEAGHVFAVVASAGGVEPQSGFGTRGLMDIARRVSGEIGPDETLFKETRPPRGWGRRVTLIAPEFDVHDALTVDPDLIAASIDYGYMRAADVLLDLGPEARELSAEIARARVRIRLAHGGVSGFLDSTPGEALDEEERDTLLRHERERLRALVARRCELGLPLAPALHDESRIGVVQVEVATGAVPAGSTEFVPPDGGPVPLPPAAPVAVDPRLTSSEGPP